jgi:hypothetical protein
MRHKCRDSVRQGQPEQQQQCDEQDSKANECKANQRPVALANTPDDQSNACISHYSILLLAVNLRRVDLVACINRLVATGRSMHVDGHRRLGREVVTGFVVVEGYTWYGLMNISTMWSHTCSWIIHPQHYESSHRSSLTGELHAKRRSAHIKETRFLI